jgi:hypothetical protein
LIFELEYFRKEFFFSTFTMQRHASEVSLKTLAPDSDGGGGERNRLPGTSTLLPHFLFLGLFKTKCILDLPSAQT